ncbi:Uncharacterized protein XB16_3714 [Leptospira santarosai]|uniref:Uncharacterized protein n=1 Tax=Leptospira santarosai TaxID=28183 RepID=A0A2P1QYK4_9LEPT|nr:Uncharacterized protein XB16_3714 [Leptospira santarosai]
MEYIDDSMDEVVRHFSYKNQYTNSISNSTSF